MQTFSTLIWEKVLAEPMLRIRDLHAYYDKSHVLAGVNLDVGRGRISSILGRNGTGRSTTLKAAMGIVRPSKGTVLLDGIEIVGESPAAVARKGLLYVPEERLVFSNLSVLENLRAGQQSRRAGCHQWAFEDIFTYFPRLRERQSQKAGTLSGGEQQMLTISRSMMGNPKVMLIDEPTEGLAPKIVQNLKDVLVDIAAKGVAIVLVEQKLTIALAISHEIFVMGHGEMVFRGSVDDFESAGEIRKRWLTVA